MLARKYLQVVFGGLQNEAGGLALAETPLIDSRQVDPFVGLLALDVNEQDVGWLDDHEHRLSDGRFLEQTGRTFDLENRNRKLVGQEQVRVRLEQAVEKLGLRIACRLVRRKLAVVELDHSSQLLADASELAKPLQPEGFLAVGSSLQVQHKACQPGLLLQTQVEATILELLANLVVH